MEEKEVYKTNGVLVLAALAIYAFFLLRHGKSYEGFLIAGLTLLVIQLLFFKLSYYIAFGWIQFGKALGYVNSRILLSIVFFLVVAPIGLLRSKKPAPTSSNWKAASGKVDFWKMW